nr:integrase, catalytic region, zinc finger, CCHC-type, peptidase aspartic, catalytic [Tanacetum cinerariifolium]
MENLIENLTNILALLTQSYKHTFLKQIINSELHQIQGTKQQFKMAGLSFRMFRVDRTEERETIDGVQVQLLMGGAQNRVGYANPGGQDNDVDEDVDEQPVQDLALNVDNVFQADDCDAFDSDVDKAPTA